MKLRYFSFIAIVAATAFGTAGAFAADIPARAPVYKAAPLTTARTWTGWYVGVNAGGAWGRSQANTSTVFSPVGYFATTSVPAIAAVGAQTPKSHGAVAGGQIGHNWQMGNTVLGLESDFQYYGLKGSSTGSGIYPCCAPTGFTVNTAVKSDWLFTARPRIGWTADSWLLYVTGGVAASQVKANFTFTDTFATASESAAISKTKAGWTAGGGVEWAAQGPWSVKVEYLHVDLGRVSGASTNLTAFTPAIPFPSNVFTHGVNLRSDLVRVGLNYRFQ